MKSDSSISISMKNKSEKKNKNHAIGITMNVSSWNGKCVTQIFMATTRRIFKTEWTTLTNEKKEKIGKK